MERDAFSQIVYLIINKIIITCLLLNYKDLSLPCFVYGVCGVPGNMVVRVGPIRMEEEMCSRIVSKRDDFAEMKKKQTTTQHELSRSVRIKVQVIEN